VGLLGKEDIELAVIWIWIGVVGWDQWSVVWVLEPEDDREWMGKLRPW
jgi:hypothetical protein